MATIGGVITTGAPQACGRGIKPGLAGGTRSTRNSIPLLRCGHQRQGLPEGELFPASGVLRERDRARPPRSTASAGA